MKKLEMRNLTCAYNGHSVLEDLCMEAQPGQVLVLIGPNGVGKTLMAARLAQSAAQRLGAGRRSEARAKKYRMNRICATHADYLRLSNGDADVALNFLKKAYSDSEITEAQEWYPNFVVQD